MTHTETFPTWSNTRGGAIWALVIAVFGGLGLVTLIALCCHVFSNPENKVALLPLGMLAAVAVLAVTFFLGFTDERPLREVYVPAQILFATCLYIPMIILSLGYNIVDAHFGFLLMVQMVGYAARFSRNPAAI